MGKLVYVLNGPNLNLLGKRQPDIYGSETLADVEERCRNLIAGKGFNLLFRQSNAEHELIEWIHQARTDAYAIIINAGAYSHTSIAILDALNIFDGKVVEVHISDIKAREEFRHHSFVSFRADKEVIGEGTYGYLIALKYLITDQT